MFVNLGLFYQWINTLRKTFVFAVNEINGKGLHQAKWSM